ncbi:hypothetical protein [Wolbachia endosymbiont (group E) of Neria commutata]|uniref:hypothetical protein n=1 Tax=Wolbachia endosymbiont (group E) of Neria commutata TaxID=3066149 RepID=UPI003132C426
MTENIISERKVISKVNVTSEVSVNSETGAKKSNRRSVENVGAALMLDPAYKERLIQFLNIARGSNMDAVHCDDGTIIFIEPKPVMTSYVWDPKKREFVRKKQQAIAKSDNCST